MAVNLAVIPGDGVGPEVVAQALAALDALHGLVDFQITEYDLGAARYQRTGEVLPAAEQQDIAQKDAILLGAVGHPALPSGLLERGLLLKLRFDFDHYVNLRPAQYYPGVPTPLAHPGEIDFLVVREGTEGLYVGTGGSMRAGTPHEVATEVSQNTAFGVERVVRYAFAQAAARRGKLTLVHKHNVLVHAGKLWQRIVTEVGAEFPAVETNYLHVDAATIALVVDPGQFDVIVTDNLFGDILTDEAGAVTGGIGLAASGNINPDGAFPSMFEPVHGSAPDIAGTGKADPIAAISSTALMLDHLGEKRAAQVVRQAVATEMAYRAADPASAKRNTSEVGAAVAENIAAALKAN
ncbi:MAG: 3-isopropylmalate dehydrogenase [Trueperella sp.]|nr:3-isopropylmalate dehydrogenase [Trueperella sp.]